MKLHSKKLKDGLTIQVVEMPGTNVVTSLILVGAGSRYEDKKINGIAHFLEHMFFKGGEKYRTCKKVASTVDNVGGDFNAFTGKEYAGYYVKSGKESVEIGLDVLSDMLIKARFPEEEIEKERGVILEEIAMYLDFPMRQIGNDFIYLLFGDQPLGREILGNPKVIKSVIQKDFFDYKKALYVPENIVITLAGAVIAEDISRVEKFFSFDNSTKVKEADAFDPNIVAEKFHVREKQTEQYHIAFGVRGLPKQDNGYTTQRILANILGGNMSSRLFQNIREEKGLCYSIRTGSSGFTDASVFVTHAGVKLQDVLRAVEAIRLEYDLIAQKGVSHAELKNAKSFIQGRTDLETEDTEEVAMHYAENKLLHNSEESFEELKDKVSCVTREDVNALAKKLLQPERYHFAGIGPKLDEEKLLSLIS